MQRQSAIARRHEVRSRFGTAAGAATRRAAFYHYEPFEIGGPCGLRSRYLSLDRRVLWLIELTDLEMDAGVGVAPTKTGL